MIKKFTMFFSPKLKQYLNVESLGWELDLRPYGSLKRKPKEIPGLRSCLEACQMLARLFLSGQPLGCGERDIEKLPAAFRRGTTYKRWFSGYDESDSLFRAIHQTTRVEVRICPGRFGCVKAEVNCFSKAKIKAVDAFCYEFDLVTGEAVN
ncbi:MAG: hypothetical protein V1821_03545 [bacterium]